MFFLEMLIDDRTVWSGLRTHRASKPSPFQEKSAQREKCTKSAWNVDKKNIVVIIHGIIPKRKIFTSSSSNRAFQMFQSFKSGEIISTLYFHPSSSFWLDHFAAQLNKMWTLNFEMKFRNANM